MSTKDTTTIHEFISVHNITLTSEWADSNPHMEDSAKMDNYKCLLKMGRKRMTVYFSKGFGHNGVAPEVDEVLDCLASDASSYDNSSSFEEWAGDFGYSEDSRRAEKTYSTIGKQAAKLKAFLGDESYQQLLWNMERL